MILLKSISKMEKLKLVCGISIISSCSVYLTQAQFQGEALKFKLSAVNLPSYDLDGPSDPYVKLFANSGGGGRHHGWYKFGQTSVKMDDLNPVWDEEFVYEYINGSNQRWRFIVKDLDNTWLNPIDDYLGTVELKVDDYVFQIRNSQSKQNQTALQYVQMFLSHPIGGQLRVTPTID